MVNASKRSCCLLASNIKQADRHVTAEHIIASVAVLLHGMVKANKRFCCLLSNNITQADRHVAYGQCQVFLPRVKLCLRRGGQGKGMGMVAPLVHLLVSGGPSDQARAARALSNMATDTSVKEQIVAAGMPLLMYMSLDPGLSLGTAAPVMTPIAQTFFSSVILVQGVL